MDFRTLHSRELNGGIQYIFRAKNGYGASIVQHSFSYGRENGLWELAVIKFFNDDIYDYHINYDTEITDDVLGHLTESEVNSILKEIEVLKETA